MFRYKIFFYVDTDINNGIIGMHLDKIKDNQLLSR